MSVLGVLTKAGKISKSIPKPVDFKTLKPKFKIERVEGDYDRDVIRQSGNENLQLEVDVEPDKDGFISATLEDFGSGSSEGGRGLATNLYLEAFKRAKSDSLGWKSEESVTDATVRMYERLMSLGVQVKKENGRYVIPPEELTSLDIDRIQKEFNIPRGQAVGAVGAGALSGQAQATEQPFDFSTMSRSKQEDTTDDSIKANRVSNDSTANNRDFDFSSFRMFKPEQLERSTVPKVTQEGLEQHLGQEFSQILKDEGEVLSDGKHVSYKDSKGKLTGGKGHLMTEAERKKYPEGTEIPDEQVRSWEQEDQQDAVRDLSVVLKKQKIEQLPQEVQQILLNMVFNMGPNNLGEFNKMFEALRNNDFKEASKEMIDSDWYNEVGDRAKRLVDRMKDI